MIDSIKRWRRGCVVCSRSTANQDMMAITISDLIRLRNLLKDVLKSFLRSVDQTMFQYKGLLLAVDGLSIDRHGLLTADELIHGAPVLVADVRRVTCQSKGLSYHIML